MLSIANSSSIKGEFYCSYSGYLIVESLAENALEASRNLAASAGLPLDLGNDYLDFQSSGRDTNRFVVAFLRELANIVCDASGEIRCEISTEDRDPLFEFFTIREKKLLVQHGTITRATAYQCRLIQDGAG